MVINCMVELVRGENKNSDWFPKWSKFCNKFNILPVILPIDLLTRYWFLIGLQVQMMLLN